MTAAELAAYVQTHLRAAHVETVLSGGTCVSIWSANAYRSDDIDLIPEGFTDRPRIRATMQDLGFAERNRYFVREDTALWVEFPSGPLVVGEERPQRIDMLETNAGILRLLSPTDCVKDRLTWWLHGNDAQCLEQATQVAATASVDVNELRRWARGEHKVAEFDAIASRFARRSRDRDDR